MAEKTTFEIARETLKQLTVRKMPPTPLNYQRVYSEIAQLPIEPPFPADRLRDIAVALPTKTPGQQKQRGLLESSINHLNWDGVKNALMAYDGTLILVSHDREFLDGLVNKVYEFRDQKIKEHLGGIYDFLHRKKISSFKELERKALEPAEIKVSKQTDNKQLYEMRKEQDKIIRKAKNELARIEKQISELEESVKKADLLFAIPENLSDQKLFDKYTHEKHELDKLMAEWEIQQNEIEKLNTERG